MVLNIELADAEVEALGGGKVVLSAPGDLASLPLGVAAFDPLEAVISAAGLTMCFELEPEEVRAIQRGTNKFLLHFHIDPSQGVPPFRFIFERTEFAIDNGAAKEDHPQSGLPDSTGEPEAD